jgi:PKD repeat protein
VVDFYFYPANPTFFDTIQFYDNSYDPAQAGIQSYRWNFGDGTRSTEPNPTHRYAKDGNYTVRHTIKTVDGRTASTTQIVHVKTQQVFIDIKPSTKINRIVIGSGSDATVAVAILSTRRFNAPRQVDRDSLTFGHTGDENSLNRTGSNLTPDCSGRDVNHDDRRDLVCRFLIGNTGFQPGDTVGILKGLTVAGVEIQGRDSVVIIIHSP